MKNLFSTKNMVRGDFIVGEIPSSPKAYKESLRIALPSVVEMTSMALIMMMSTAMVGQLGPEAVAAVGLTGQPRMIFLSLFFALNVGVTAVVARRKGQGEQESARLCLRQALIIGFFLSFIMAALAVFLANHMMRLAGAQYDAIDMATSYFRITSMGLTLNALTMTITAAQRGIGNTRVTMVVNVAANIVNVLFHFLLIEGRLFFPAMGIEGAAVAILISAAVGLGLAVFSVTKRGAYLQIRPKDSWKINPDMMGSIAKVGGNTIFEQLCMRIGFFAYARVVAQLGTMAFSAHQIGMQMMNLSFTFADGIAVATTALVGQNLGAKRPDLSIMFGKIGQRMAFCVSMVLVTSIFFGRYWFPTLFVDYVLYPDIVDTAAGLLLIAAFILPFQTSQIVMAGSLRGSGDTRFVAITMLICVALVRPLVSVLLVFVIGLGIQGAWYAIIVDQILRLVLLYGRFSSGKWTKIKV
ncbi:MAG: MATE family efflux transporter [Defluviitaleaceae bacterium]|nr:MATE family efflux transporter [Defluviitaleaceae bacterium]